MFSTEPKNMETNYNLSRLRYRYQNQTRPSTWEIYEIFTDFLYFWVKIQTAPETVPSLNTLCILLKAVLKTSDE